MVRDIRLDPTIELTDLPQNRSHMQRIQAAAPPVERMQRKAMRCNLGTFVTDPACDMHIVARALRRKGHRQPVHQEIPILRDEEK